MFSSQFRQTARPQQGDDKCHHCRSSASVSPSPFQLQFASSLLTANRRHQTETRSLSARSTAADIRSVSDFILTAIKYFKGQTAAVSIQRCFGQQPKRGLHVAGGERLHQASQHSPADGKIYFLWFSHHPKKRKLDYWLLDTAVSIGFPTPALGWKCLTVAWWFRLSPFSSDWHFKWNLLFSLPDYLAQMSMGSLHKARVILSN